MNRPIYPLAAVSRLLGYGAHLVLTAPWGKTKRDGTQSKRAMWEKFLQRPASFLQVKDHISRGGLLGIVPASLGRAVLDVDRGDPVPLICAHLPWFVARSQQPGRVHLWYRDDAEHRPGGIWRDGNGGGGEMLASTGYVVLWGNTLQELTEALAYGDHATQAPFEAVANTLTWRSSKRSKTEAQAPAAEDRTRNPSVGAHQDLSKVFPGHRNVSLFDDVRIWSYRAYRRFEHYDHFADATLQRALKGRSQMPILEDFDAEEATAIARSVATWTWAVRPTYRSRLSARDTDSLGQRTSSKRSPSTGEHEYHGDPALNGDSEVQRRRRGRRTALDAVRTGQRQTRVAARFRLGAELPDLATAFGCSRRTILRDLEAADLPSRRQARRMLQAEGEQRQRKRAAATEDTLQAKGEETSRQSPKGNGMENEVNPEGENPPHPTFKNGAPRRSPPDYGLVSQNRPPEPPVAPGPGPPPGPGGSGRPAETNPDGTAAQDGPQDGHRWVAYAMRSRGRLVQYLVCGDCGASELN